MGAIRYCQILFCFILVGEFLALFRRAKKDLPNFQPVADFFFVLEALKAAKNR